MANEKKAPAAEKMRSPFGISMDAASFPGPAPVISDSEIAETLYADVVVAGGGNGGLNAALAAVECGAKTVVIEQRAEDKMHWNGEQIGTFNSKFLTEKGFGGYNLDDIIDEFCRANAYYINRSLIAKYVKNSGEMLDHLLSFVPPESTLLNDDQCNVHCGVPGTKYPIVRGGYRTWAGTLQFRGDLVTTRDVRYRVNQFSRLPELCRYAMQESVRLGTDWRFGHTVTVLLKDGDRVTGIIAKRPDGKYVKVMASRGVILAVGSFGPLGYQLGVWAGGHMDNTPLEPQKRSFTPGARSPLDGPGIFSPFGTHTFTRLNARGRRYRNECIPYGNAEKYQPAGVMCWVSDSKWLDELKLNGLQHGNVDFGMQAYIGQMQEDMGNVVAAGKDGYDVRNGGLTERETGKVYGANTLEELADIFGYTGSDKQNFLDSIERYNELCKKGHDEDFGKDSDVLFPIDSPPYYGEFMVIPEGGSWERANTVYSGLNGLATDNDFAVVDGNCDPIPGLFAIGCNCGYLHSVFYSTPCGGNYIGIAMTSGRVTGKHVASL